MDLKKQGREVDRIVVTEDVDKRRALVDAVINTFTAIVDLSRFNNSCLKSRQLRP